MTRDRMCSEPFTWVGGIGGCVTDGNGIGVTRADSPGCDEQPAPNASNVVKHRRPDSNARIF